MLKIQLLTNPVILESQITEPYWKYTKADAELDITNTSLLSEYVGQFDKVVLERIWDKPLNHPYTLLNAAKMLKVGGSLFVDVHDSYRYDAYNMDNQNSLISHVFKGLTNEEVSSAIPQFVYKIGDIDYISLQSFADMRDESTCQQDVDQLINHLNKLNIRTKTTKNDYNKQIKMDASLEGVSYYLVFLGFDYNIGFNDVTSPFCGRKGSMLVATKIDSATYLMKSLSGTISKYFNQKYPKSGLQNSKS